jgi:NDP-4-keto-2,6-dideoxyhexose 3-C-methyltransferase
MTYTERKVCRACHRDLPKNNILDLGTQAIVDFVANGQDSRGSAPLQLAQCDNEDCGLLQLRHTVDSDTLYRKFWYRSGINEQMKTALSDVVRDSKRYVSLRTNDIICDIGSNDGTMLGFYPPEIRKVGFEPAEELAEESMRKKIRNLHMVDDYFTGAKALSVSQGKKYKIVTAIAMFYDLDNPLQFLKDVASTLHDDGIFVVQMNYLGLMIRNLTFDNISHEHLCYYSLTSLAPLFTEAGLKIVDVELNDVNGGSFRVYARKNEKTLVTEDVVSMMLNEEAETLSPRAIAAFGERVSMIATQLREFIIRLHEAGKQVYAYGASTRGSTLLQTLFQPATDASKYIAGAAERDEHKIGKVTAGTELFIVSEETARILADFFLVLPYHFLDSILQREKRWMLKGGKLIVPLPHPRVYSATQNGNGKIVSEAVELTKELEALAK